MEYNFYDFYIKYLSDSTVSATKFHRDFLDRIVKLGVKDMKFVYNPKVFDLSTKERTQKVTEDAIQIMNAFLNDQYKELSDKDLENL